MDCSLHRGEGVVIGETVLRFLLGGTIVSLFAIVGTVLRPPTFAGMFGSAPSVALATMMLAFANQGPGYVATEAQSMALGAVGLVAYSAACARGVAWRRMPVWAEGGLCWTVWLTVTFVLWMIVRGVA
jgi:hypothetical protein